ncbi:MAG: hypothetical protein KME52_24620, partial [Desmonostoc geniculatum HA4340-LM1]|nr:hypothetical protein [Desmonostoc geniculatum HA4340-LM1]
ISTQLGTRVSTYFILFTCTLFSFILPNLLIYLGFSFILQTLRRVRYAVANAPFILKGLVRYGLRLTHPTNT